MSNKLRIRFSKTGRAKYISHLDLMATMRRGLLRAGVNLKYSEGFNPHPYMSAALPLSVGLGSVCELLDFGAAAGYIPPDDLAVRLTAALPEGIEVFEVYASHRKFADIKWTGINGSLTFDAPRPNAARKLTQRFAATSIIISKKTKSGTSEVDIVPLIDRVDFEGEGEVILKARVHAQNPSLTPHNLLSALSGEYAELTPDFAMFTRTEVYDANMNVFR